MDKIERLIYLRKKVLDLTQKELALKLNISHQNISNIELKKISLTNRICLEICRIYNINRAWLETGEGEIFSNSFLDEKLEYLHQNLNEENRCILIAFSMVLELFQEGKLNKEAENYLYRIIKKRKLFEPKCLIRLKFLYEKHRFPTNTEIYKFMFENDIDD